MVEQHVTFPEPDPNEELYHLYIPKGKQTMGDFTMEVLPEIYEALQSQKTTGTAPPKRTCLYSEPRMNPAYVRATLDMFPQVAAMSPLCCNNTDEQQPKQQQPKQQQPPPKQTPEEHRIATQRCDKSWRAPLKSGSPGKKKQWEALSAYVRSDRCPLLARGEEEAEAQGPSSYLRWLFTGPSVGSFRGLLKERPLVLLVSRNVTSGQVSNERDIRNIGEVTATVVSWAAAAGWHAIAPLVLERPDMTHALQAFLFRHAAVVIAQHGASLHNLYFTEPTDTAVLEVPPVWQPTYQQLTGARRQRSAQPASRVVSSSKKGKPRVVTVDVKGLARNLCDFAAAMNKDRGTACGPKKKERRGRRERSRGLRQENATIAALAATTGVASALGW